MFEPAGAEAREVLRLFWFLLPCAAVIWAAVVGGTWYAMHWQRGRLDPGSGQRLIVLGGVLLPTLLLGGLTALSLGLMVDLRSAEPDRVIRVTGEQFWWRVEYLGSDGAVRLRTANEFVIPLGETVDLELVTADVIHSFWVPALAGKVDMIPGMTNRLQLQAEKTGSFRGQCAEFCGDSHALMAFRVRVVEPGAFQQWWRRQQAPAVQPAGGAPSRGQALFLGYGCGACHTIRGTPASGRLGPDLTHLAERAMLGAETFENDQPALLRWLRHPQTLKPGAKMPSFEMLEPAELSAIVSYLRSLE